MRTHALFLVALAVLIPLYAWRLTLGVDVSDEGYYAALSVSWLRSTPAETGNLSPHQFSAVLYHPLVWGYSQVRPDLTGLILFLRAAYLLGSLATTFAAYRLFAKVSSPAVATASALVLFVFIPLGLPAVSYNTLALFGLASGLFTVARGLLDRDTGTGGRLAGVVGALLMAAGGCAYPSVAAASPLALAVLFVLFRSHRRFVVTSFAVWLLGTLALLGLITMQLGGVGRMADVIDFTRKLYSGSVGEKATAAGVALFGDGQLWMPCAVAALLGVLRRLRPSGFTRTLHLAGCVGVAAWWIACDRPTALFAKSHDVVVMLVAGLVPLFRWPASHLPTADRLLSVLFAVGVGGGLLVATSAVAGLVNFPVFGIVAVACGLAIAGREGESNFTPCSAGLLAALVWTTLTYFYAEVPVTLPTLAPQSLPLAVDHGPYAGLRTADWKLRIVDSVETQLRPYAAECKTIDCWTSNSGLYLLTPLELRSPMPYWMEDAKTTHLHETLKAHYANTRNRPDVVVLWTQTQDQDTKVDREQLAVLAEWYEEQPAESPIRIFLRKGVAMK